MLIRSLRSSLACARAGMRRGWCGWGHLQGILRRWGLILEHPGKHSVELLTFPTLGIPTMPHERERPPGKEARSARIFACEDICRIHARHAFAWRPAVRMLAWRVALQVHVGTVTRMANT